MGYRSHVCLVMTKSVYKDMLEYMNQVDSETRDDMHSILREQSEEYLISPEGSILYYWNWVKWYEEYKGIIAIHKLLENSNQEEYLFLRVGENDSDTEVLGKYYDNPFDASIIRTISYTKN